MKSLDVKLLRDLARMKGQLITIALVVAAGIAAYVSLEGNYVSLERARTTYYQRFRLGDVFARCERAPKAALAELEALPGVATARVRLVRPATVDLEAAAEPIRAQVVSLAPDEPLDAGSVDLRAGRAVDPHQPEEALLLEAFAAVYGIEPGERVKVVLNGRERELHIVGIAMSPEHVMVAARDDLAPDPRRFAVLWMDEDALGASFDLRGAFNDVVITLRAGAPAAPVIEGTDRVLERYGGLGAIDVSKLPSNAMVEGELEQLAAMSTVLPAIFLGVAALLLNVVLSRLVHLQRGEIATLKALGYRDLEVGIHFLELVLVIACVGSLAGVAVGTWLGRAMLALYAQYFHFPGLSFQLDPASAALGVAVSVGAALLGAFSAVRGVVALPPAEAMQPAAPSRYRRSILDRLGLAAVAGTSANMVVRELERRPLRTLTSVVAVAASVGLMVVGGWYSGGIGALLDTQFHDTMREDVVVSFLDAQPERAVRELAALPGVLEAEGLRSAPVRIHAGHRRRDAVLTAYPDGARLRQPRDLHGVAAALPEDGVVLTRALAEILHVGVGDTVEVELREGERARGPMLVGGLVDESFGLQGHVRMSFLEAWTGEERAVSQALLRVDPRGMSELDARLKRLPAVAGVRKKADLLTRFREQSAAMILTISLIITLFAATITVGVVYNNARVALSLRGRELATLRVLGFHRGEVSAILLGEIALQVLLALPLGVLFGKWMVVWLVSTVDPETYRIPIVLTGRTYAVAALVALAASVASGLLVRRKLDRLDLIGVLKTRE